MSKPISNDVLKIQRGLARKAMASPSHRFEKLWRVLYQEDWLKTAQAHVLSNKGARTPGVDGVTKKDLQAETQKAAQIARILENLKSGKYRPQPVRRKDIPKPGKKETRPLGIPTMDDRVVQEAVRMMLEPIWESDFLECSSGFRPGRKTWDAISEIYNRIPNSHNRHRWIIEGDIRKCFDRINHNILLKLIEKRVNDRRIVNLIAGMLKAGVMDDGIFARTEEGTPQGGPISPLLANIYLHELDVWMQRHGPGLTPSQKRQRRTKHIGNAIYVRYADDFVILWNGPRSTAEALREELRLFLTNELHLELSLEKTKITHATEGFDFLGYHVQYMRPKDNKPWLRVTPNHRSIERFKGRIRKITQSRGASFTREDDVIRLINAVVRGWGNYYRNCNFTELAQVMDRFVWFRVQNYLYKKHKGLSLEEIYNQYCVRDPKGRKAWAAKWRSTQMLYLAKMTDIKKVKYHHQNQPNPYLGEEPVPTYEDENPLPDETWTARETDRYLAAQNFRDEIFSRDKGQCVSCHTSDNLHVHHLNPKGDRFDPENAVTLCSKCHQKAHQKRGEGILPSVFW